MLNVNVIGNLGADAELKTANGRSFVTFRVAHSVSITKNDGTTTEETTWIDCIGNNLDNLLPHLKKGSQVYVEGSASLRVYSSKVDRCMKAGITVHVGRIQFIGAKPDLVPREVIDPEDGSLHTVKRAYMVADLNGIVEPDKYKTLVDAKGNEYFVDTLGFIQPSPTTKSAD